MIKKRWGNGGIEKTDGIKNKAKYKRATKGRPYIRFL